MSGEFEHFARSDQDQVTASLEILYFYHNTNCQLLKPIELMIEF